MLDKKEQIKKCLNCTKPECDLCEKKKYDNKSYCKGYYQDHKEAAKERVRRSRFKKRVAQCGYEMALLI